MEAAVSAVAWAVFTGAVTLAERDQVASGVVILVALGREALVAVNSAALGPADLMLADCALVDWTRVDFAALTLAAWDATAWVA